MQRSWGQNISRGSMIVPVIVILCVVFVMFAVYVILNKHTVPISAVSQSTPSSEKTNPPIDYAPNLPMNQKTTVVIRQSDSSTMTYLIPNNQVEMFTKKLPEGETIVSKTRN